MTLTLGQRKFSDPDEEMNYFFAAVNLGSRLRDWEGLSGNKDDIKGLLSFYKSDHYKSLPYENLHCNLNAKIMTDPQPIRSGDPMDIQHISTVMPFSDLFITDKAWSLFLQKKGYDKKYQTSICYIGDTEKISNFFSKL